MYRATCTWCAPLLMNCDKLKDAYYCHDEYATYIEVNSEELAELIEKLNEAQEATFKYYNKILKMLRKES